MSTKSFIEVTTDTRTMVAALTAHIDQVSKRGADVEYIVELEAQLHQSMILSTQVAELKSQLKLKTAELETTFTTLKKKYSEARKIVKLSVDQAGWKAFGIEDIR